MELRYSLHMTARAALAWLAALTMAAGVIGSIVLWSHRSPATHAHTRVSWGFLCLGGGTVVAALLGGVSLCIGLLLDVRSSQLGEPEGAPQHLLLKRKLRSLRHM